MTSQPARTEAERRRALFYTEASEGDAYDIAADLHTPQFSLMHRTMLDLVQYHFGVPFGADPAGVEATVLDIGSGTGAEAVRLLTAFPQLRVVAFDLCEPMHHHFRARAARVLGDYATVASRCEFVTGDIAGPEGDVPALLEPLARRRWTDRYSLIISALALHHLSDDEKRLVCRRIHAVLQHGGLFLNGDLFTFQSRDLHRQADHFLLNWIDRQFRAPDPGLAPAAEALGPRREELRTAWLDHCRNYNVPAPIEMASEVLADESSARPSYDEMLKEAGFSEIGVPFRFWQVGILWAKK